MIGTVKKLMEKGFGFISSPDLLKENIQWDMFFHFSALEGWSTAFNSLKEGQKVSFEISEKRDWKKQATNVMVLADETPKVKASGKADNYEEDAEAIAA